MTGRTNAGGGIQLPALTNPAAAGNIQSGYQAINGEGEVVTGTYVPQTVEYEFLTGSEISFDAGSRFELKLTLPKPISQIVGLSLVYKSVSLSNDQVFFMHPSGTYNVLPQDDNLWVFLTRNDDFYNLYNGGVSGATVTYYISSLDFNSANYEFFCGACKYIPA